jgi:hypothetical protein
MYRTQDLLHAGLFVAYASTFAGSVLAENLFALATIE